MNKTLKAILISALWPITLTSLLVITGEEQYENQWHFFRHWWVWLFIILPWIGIGVMMRIQMDE